MSIGGYGEAVVGVPSSTRDDGGESGKNATFDMLRGVIYVGYKFNGRFLLNTEIEFEHGSTSESGSASVEFAYIDLLCRDAFKLRGGLVLLPMGWLNELHEPTVYLGSLRPLSEQRIIPSTWRECSSKAGGRQPIRRRRWTSISRPELAQSGRLRSASANMATASS